MGIRNTIGRAGLWLTRYAFGRRMALRAAKYAGIPLRDPALVALLGHQPSASGIDVDESTAMNYSAVFQAVNIISQSIATLPIEMYRRGQVGEVEKNHPLSHLLRVCPNYEMTSVVFHETLQAHLLTWGNAYARIEREKDNNPDSPIVAIWPMMPNQVEPDRRNDNGELFYRFKAMYPGEHDEDIPTWKMIHVPGLGFDGIRGYSVIQMAREGIGLGLATERCGAAFFGRGARPGGVLEHPGELTPEAQKNIRESWELLHRGPDNAHRIAILEEGMQWKPTAIPNDDAQFLQTRQFQIVEVARWFNIPPHLLRDLSQATFSNIEHQGIDFLTYTLRPWLVKWVQEYARKLLRRKEQDQYYFGHVVSALLQTDTTARYAAYQSGRNTGFLKLNDILRAENRPLLPDDIGETVIQPVNMQVAGREPPPPAFDAAKVSTAAQLIAQLGIEGTAAENVIKEAGPQLTDETVREIAQAAVKVKPQPAQPQPRDLRVVDDNGANHDASGKFGTGSGSGKKINVKALGKKSFAAIAKVGGTVAHAEHVAKEWVQSKAADAVAKLPKPLQKPVRGVWAAIRLGTKASFVSYTAGQALAEKVSKARGSTPEQAAKLRATLSAIDIAAMKPVSIALGSTGAGAAAIGIASMIPVASAAYLAYSGAAYTLSKAKKAVAGIVSRRADKPGELIHRVAKFIENDWHHALFMAALNDNTVADALDIAEQAAEKKNDE